MRLIDADALMNEFNRTLLGNNPRGVIRATIEDAPSVEPEQRWIPCSERLPEDYAKVLITTKYGIEFGHYDEEEKMWEWLCESGTNYWEECDSVIAWMPLPEPYDPLTGHMNEPEE